MRATPKLQRRNRGGGEEEASGELLSTRDDPEKSGVWNGLLGKEVYSAGRSGRRRRGGEFSSCSFVTVSRGEVPGLLGEFRNNGCLMRRAEAVNEMMEGWLQHAMIPIQPENELRCLIQHKSAIKSIQTVNTNSHLHTGDLCEHFCVSEAKDSLYFYCWFVCLYES